MAGRVLTIRNSESRAQQKTVSRVGIANSCKSVPGGLAGGDGGQRHPRREGAVTAAQPTGDGGPADGNTVGEEGVTVLLAGVFSSLK